MKRKPGRPRKNPLNMPPPTQEDELVEQTEYQGHSLQEANWPGIEILRHHIEDPRLDGIESALKAIVESLRPNTYRTWESHAMRENALKAIFGQENAKTEGE